MSDPKSSINPPKNQLNTFDDTPVADSRAATEARTSEPTEGDACLVLHIDTDLSDDDNRNPNRWARVLSRSTYIPSVKVYTRGEAETMFRVVRRRNPVDYDECPGFDADGYSLKGADGHPIDQWVEDRLTGLRYDVRSLNENDIREIEAGEFNAYLSRRCPLEVRRFKPYTMKEPHPVYLAYSVVISNLEKQGLSTRPRIYRGGIKRAITHYSKKSELYFKETLEMSGIRWRSTLTVTFGAEYPTDGQEAKLIFGAVRNALDRYLGDRGRVDDTGLFTYAWCREFQTKRKVIHWHIILPCDVTREDRRWWATWWSNYQGKKYNLSREQRGAIYRVNAYKDTWDNEHKEGALPHYISTYMAKGEQKEVPEGFTNPGRFWGKSANVRPKEIGEIDINLQGNLESVAAIVMSKEVLPPVGMKRNEDDSDDIYVHGGDIEDFDRPLSMAELSSDELFVRELVGSYRPEFYDLRKTPVLRSVLWGCPPVQVLEGLKGFRYCSGEREKIEPVKLEIGPFREVNFE